MEIKSGSRWWAAGGQKFVVISTTVLEDKEWVYYRAEKPKDDMPHEFSCYKESFLTRFSPLPE